MKAVKISEHVWWVGAIDWALKEFHGYTTHRGTTYNAFLIMADKITLIDTVKAPFKNEMYARIASVVDPAKIDYIISNHAEMDHSGALPEVIRDLNPEKVFASVAGVKALHDHFRIGDKLTPVKTGDSISLGNMNVSFVETKMLHWPDSMFTYLAEDKVLFSQDGFGMHLATNQIFADENDWNMMETEMKRYYANILLPYAPQALKLLEVFPSLNLDIALIAPDHGPIWRGDLLLKPLELYGKWAAQAPVKQALVIYDTMWHSTEKMAFEIADGIRSTGVEVKVMALDGHSRSDVAAEMLDIGALVVGSPTINNGLFPRTADVLTYLKGLRPKNLKGAAFGSFGWSGEAAAQITEQLNAMNCETMEPLKLKFASTKEDFEACFEYGVKIGEAIKDL